MELRHLTALMAIADEGTFTAAADVLNTAQSNVSEQIRQFEGELGTQLFARGRRGAVLTESGQVVLERARRIHRELEAMRVDVASVQGLQTGEASLGIVGTASRWLVPKLVGKLREAAPGIRFHVTEAPSERLADLVLAQELAQAIVTETRADHRLVSAPLFAEALVGLAPAGFDIDDEPVPMERFAQFPLVVPPPENPLRRELDAAAAAAGVELASPVEVDGVRLIVDIVADGFGVTALPTTALPSDRRGLRVFPVVGMPRRRLARITSREAHLSLADDAVRAALEALVAEYLRVEKLPLPTGEV